MASCDQPYGKSVPSGSSKSSTSYKGSGPGSPEPRLKFQPSLPYSTSTSGHEAYIKTIDKGPSTSNKRPMANETSAFTAQRWNPASLLNPRGFHSEQQMVANGFTNNAPPQQLAFQFDSPASSAQQPSHTHSHSHSNSQFDPNKSNGLSGYADGGGMGHMLERMHNVADRGMLPQKRRKVTDKDPTDGRKVKFHGGGRGGVIGEYIREKREEGQQENVANRAAVDLSSGLSSLFQMTFIIADFF